MVERIHVEGLSDLRTALEELPKSVGKSAIRRVLMLRAKVIADAARALCPVSTGELKDSITASTKLSQSQQREAQESASYVEVYAGPGPLPFYAHMVEFGSIHNAPEPFMRPAWDANKGELLPNLRDDLWSEIEKAVDQLAHKAAKD